MLYKVKGLFENTKKKNLWIREGGKTQMNTSKQSKARA